MPYTINKTDGTVIATIQDGNIDNTTSLTLFGKSRSNFGELLNENQIKLLENSAGTSALIFSSSFPCGVPEVLVITATFLYSLWKQP